MNITDFPAQVVVHTPSGTTNACERHAHAVANVMRVLGAHVNTTPAEPGAQCDNCINEAKAGKTPE
jgi:hypothetical protein